MKVWPDADGTLVRRYLRTLGLRNNGQRTAPVVRAILRPDTAQALEALRPLPRFGSHLGQAMLQHLKRMRSLGFRYEREASRLLAFDRYCFTFHKVGHRWVGYNSPYDSA